MGAFRSLINGELAPVGQPVRTDGGSEHAPEFPGYSTFWTSSGTAALALGLMLAKARRKEIASPKVLIPAYACPDLVTAAVVARVEPVLVDIGPNTPAFCQKALENVWRDDVVAVVAVNFLGIRERIPAIRTLANGTALVIEDRAQCYPENDVDADAVILSFGRGKPVNLLGGGALLVKTGIATEPVNLPDAGRGTGFLWSAAAFNWSIRPRQYAWIARLPFLGVGETRYKPSVKLQGMDKARIRHVEPNVRAWLNRSRWREEALTTALSEVPGMSPLPAMYPELTGRLLRFPLLTADEVMRDRALKALKARGLGPSALYGRPLSRVAGVPPNVAAQGEFPGAERFAERLLTLPLHDRVTRAHIAQIVAELCEVARSSRAGGVQ